MNLRKLFAALGASTALLLGACGTGTPGAPTTPTGSQSSAASSPEAPAEHGKVMQIGVINYVSHPALDAAQKGFVEELEKLGYGRDKVSIDIQNPQADQATLTAIANQFAQDKKNLVFAIATPAAQAAAQALPGIPVLFAAVTDPVAADLVASVEAPGGNVTGASDANPVAEQLKLLLEIAPDVKKVGIVYASGEANSATQVKEAEAAASGMGLTIKKAAVSNSAEVQQAAASLDVDAYYVPTDNVVVSGIEGLLQMAEQNKRPVVASDEGTVERGAIVSQSVNYDEQGRIAARMAVKVLEGTKPADIPVETQKKFDLTINPAAAERMGLTIPATMVERAAKSF